MVPRPNATATANDAAQDRFYAYESVAFGGTAPSARESPPDCL